MSQSRPGPTGDWIIHVGFIGALLFGLSVIRGAYDWLTVFGLGIMVGSMLLHWWLGRRQQ